MIVEDEALIAEVLSDQLSREGCDVVARCDTGAGAIETAVRIRPDLILMDVRLKGDVDGPQAAEAIHEHLRVPVVYLTAHSDRATLQRAKAASAFGYVLKPYQLPSLLAAIEVAVDRFELEEKLEDAQFTSSSILRSIADGVLVTDADGNVRYMNGVAERLTGWSFEDARGHQGDDVLRFAASANPTASPNIVARVLGARSRVVVPRDEVVISRGGQRVPVEGMCTPITDNLGRLIGTTTTLRDETDERRAELEARIMSDRLRAVVDTAVDGMVLLDDVGRILMANPACERLFGYAADEVIGESIEALLPDCLTDEFGRTLVSANPRDRMPVQITGREAFARRRVGTTFPVEVSVGDASDRGQRVFVCVIHDVSERKKLEAALVDAVAGEQRRFGQDLHDGLGQELTGLSLLLAAMAQTAHKQGFSNAFDLDRALSVSHAALTSCRHIARGLSPVNEGQGGLVAGLRDLVSRMSGGSGPVIEFEAIHAEQLGLSPMVADHLYRIAQEALTNALKHAHAKSIAVTLDIEPQSVRLEVCDDGDGLMITQLESRGLGMRTMNYRAGLIGARLLIERLGTAGTCVVCDCPQAA